MSKQKPKGAGAPPTPLTDVQKRLLLAGRIDEHGRPTASAPAYAPPKANTKAKAEASGPSEAAIIAAYKRGHQSV